MNLGIPGGADPRQVKKSQRMEQPAAQGGGPELCTALHSSAQLCTALHSSAQLCIALHSHIFCSGQLQLQLASFCFVLLQELTGTNDAEGSSPKLLQTSGGSLG